MIELHGVSPASKLYEVIGTKPGLADGQCQPLRPVPCQPRALLIVLVLCADAIYIKPPNPEKPGLTLLAQPAFSLAEKSAIAELIPNAKSCTGRCRMLLRHPSSPGGDRRFFARLQGCC